VRETARHVSVSLPAHVVRRLDNLENARSRHVERAVKLYLLLRERFLPNPQNE
jgi:metal-responsive CopG/Arc/MetJ family transcriptional regulator